jgi:cell division protein FtsB
VTAGRVAAVVLVLAALFALLAGEYSTWDYLTLRREEREERARIDTLRREVDSLEKEALAAERDPAVQERLARERYGMIRDGERVYTIWRRDSVK